MLKKKERRLVLKLKPAKIFEKSLLLNRDGIKNEEESKVLFNLINYKPRQLGIIVFYTSHTTRGLPRVVCFFFTINLYTWAQRLIF